MGFSSTSGTAILTLKILQNSIKELPKYIWQYLFTHVYMEGGVQGDISLLQAQSSSTFL